jgi:hypothetical protein
MGAAEVSPFVAVAFLLPFLASDADATMKTGTLAVPRSPKECAIMFQDPISHIPLVAATVFLPSVVDGIVIEAKADFRLLWTASPFPVAGGAADRELSSDTRAITPQERLNFRE